MLGLTHCWLSNLKKKFSDFFFLSQKEILFIKSREVTLCRAWFEHHIILGTLTNKQKSLSGSKFVNSFFISEIKISEVQVLEIILELFQQRSFYFYVFENLK